MTRWGVLEGRKQAQDVYAERERWGGKFTRAVREGRVSKTRGGQGRETSACGREEPGGLGREYLSKGVL